MDEVMLLIEEILDTLIEVGNGVTDEHLHEAADKLFKIRDILEKVPGDYDVVEVVKENRALKKRCEVLSGGVLCGNCPLACEGRKIPFFGKGGVE